MFEKREGKWVGRGNCASQVSKNRTRVILWRGGEEGVVKVVKTGPRMWEDGNERQERRDKKSANGLMIENVIMWAHIFTQSQLMN